MISEGHGYAIVRRYPLATLWYEAQLARERVNNVLATQAMLTDAVITAVLSPSGKGGRRHLQNLLRDLTSGQ